MIFQEVFLEYHKKLYFFILSKTRSIYLSEEVVQLSFIKLWQFKESLDEEMSLSRQIFRIGRTTLIDCLRKEKTSLRAKLGLANTQPAFLTNEVEEWLARSELNGRISREMGKMPPMRRKIFKMSRLNGMSYKEIATELCLSVKTVENHISRAIKQLQQILSLFFLFFFLK